VEPFCFISHQFQWKTAISAEEERATLGEQIELESLQSEHRNPGKSDQNNCRYLARNADNDNQE
jgi:hypothetical protein